MNKAVTVPAALQDSVDALVRAAAAGVHNPPGPDYTEVCAWCEAEDGSGLFEGRGDEFTPVWVETEFSTWTRKLPLWLDSRE